MKAITKKQLNMYLKQKVSSGSQAELIDRVLTLARGNLSARNTVEDQESPNSCEKHTNSSDSDDSSLRDTSKSHLKMFDRQKSSNK